MLCVGDKFPTSHVILRPVSVRTSVQPVFFGFTGGDEEFITKSGAEMLILI
jgi:hypothetical protein